MTNSHLRLQRMAMVAIMGAIAFILMIFEIPNPFSVAGFLKLDISDLPVILVTWCFGPWSGLATAAIKVVLHLMVGGDWLGSLSNLISAACLIFPFNWAFQHPKWKLYKRLYIGGAVATITLTLVMSLLNLWVLVPLYSVVWGWHPSVPMGQLIALGVAPFNVLKGLILAALFALLANSLKDVVKQYQKS